jgi:hypothetical protein
VDLSLSLLTAFPGNGPGWSTQRRFQCSHICQQQMLHNVREQLSYTFLFVIYFPISNFFYSAPFQYLVCLVLIVIIFLKLINHHNRIKISACIRHMSLVAFATFGIVSSTVVFSLKATVHTVSTKAKLVLLLLFLLQTVNNYHCAKVVITLFWI